MIIERFDVYDFKVTFSENEFLMLSELSDDAGEPLEAMLKCLMQEVLLTEYEQLE